MATTPVTINIDSSLVAEAEAALCWVTNQPVSAANAKQAIINYTLRTIAQYRNSQAQAGVAPPTPTLIN